MTDKNHKPLPAGAILAAALVILLAGCAPVNRFTRVKKIPRVYSLNYCAGDIKAPRSDLNKDPWVVYSDREKNESFNRRGGKVKAKDVGYLEPFLVIGKKKGYLKLVKYTPSILKNGKLDYKKAEYYGWMPQSKLLIYNQSVTDIASGRKNKMVTAVAGALPVDDPGKYFKGDSLLLYKDLECKSPAGGVPPFSIVYRLKQSADSTLSLIARKPYISPGKAPEGVLGWVSNSLLQDIGTGLHVDIPTLSQPPFGEDVQEAHSLLAGQYPALRFSPVASYSTKDSLVAFKTRLALPLFDYSRNYIFNVNGGKISHGEFRGIFRDLKKINVSFVFEGKESTLSQFPQIVNALQNLQPVFERLDGSFSLRYNSIMAFDDSLGREQPVVTGFTPDYPQLINVLSDKANRTARLKPIKPGYSWEGLYKALEMLDTQKGSTNVLVLIGEKGVSGNGIRQDLARRLRRDNCRIIAFQVYAGEGDEYNNFVLDVENMISSYADGMLKSKCDLLVSPEQVRRINCYTQVGEVQNGYRLDFPRNSITQGALFFPQKQGTLPMEAITNNIDTLLQQICQDHKDITAHISKAFRTVGNNRTRFDSLFLQRQGMAPGRIPDKKLATGFIGQTPGWYLPSRIVVLTASANRSTGYRLLLSEKELDGLKEFIGALSALEVDYVTDANKKKERKKKPCNCPEDDLFAQLEKEGAQGNGEGAGKAEQADTVSPARGDYAGTRKIRRRMKKQYLKAVRYCKLCKESKRKVKRLTLAQAQLRITGCPTSSGLLNAYRVKDLKRKKYLPDAELDKLVGYFKKMKKELDKAVPFTSNGETYYWVDRNLLP